MSELYDHIYKTVKSIPCGFVSTYGQIAALTGNPRRSRVVGYAMAGCKDDSVPCHRVIYSDGQLAKNFGVAGIIQQRAMLESEGVTVSSDDTVDLEKFLWRI